MNSDDDPVRAGTSQSDVHEPFVIGVALNGARRTRADHPRLPVSPRELAAEAELAVDAGASLLHLHVRDADERHSLDSGRYREALAALATVADRAVVQLTTESANRFGIEQQLAVIHDLRPESCSVALREVAHDNGRTRLAEFHDAAIEADVGLQLILYDPRELDASDNDRAGNDRAITLPRLFVIGRDRPSPRPAMDLLEFLRRAGSTSPPWMVCAFGPTEHEAGLAACLLGGHARVGFENNLQLRTGSVAQHNAELVAQLVESARAVSPRPIANGREAARLFGRPSQQVQNDDDGR